MDWHGVLVLWCVGCGVLALIGYGRSLAGVTRAQRAVRVPGRIAEVRIPEHGGPGILGIPVVVAFPDPVTGQEHVLPYVSEAGIQLDAVWVGREIAVIHPPGHPERFEITYDVQDGQHGLGWPHFAVFLLYCGLVADTAILRGYPWVLLGVGVPLAVVMSFVLRHDLRLTRREAARPIIAAPGRVAAVLTSVHDDGESVWTSHTAFITFTTSEGTAVAARLRAEPKDPKTTYGAEVTVHYPPDNLDAFTLDLTATRRSTVLDIAFIVLCLLLGAAGTVAGALLL
ncbi:DUF3592 domain-containing protein [Streptomyces sp. NPDC050433]|uniref:DUF3592 domain-containing protein n=1 Tax=Streptomyces sp. NPDC050433 TaxID=3365615 RepID=UPI0037A21FC5